MEIHEYKDFLNSPFLNAIWKFSPDNMFIVRREDGVFYIHGVNPAQEKTVKLFGAEISGKKLSDVFDQSLYERFVLNYERCLNGAEPVRYEESFLNNEGRYTYWETLLIPVFPEKDRCEYVYGISRDITSRKEAEEALAFLRNEVEKADLAKLSFLANMSHEMRTPLNGISGALSLFLETTDTDEQNALARMINGSVESLSRITSDILDYAKLNAGNLRLENTSFNLGDLINGVFRSMHPMTDDRDLKLECYGLDLIPSHLFGDSTRISQILINLVGNAVKFTKEGIVSVHLNVSASNASVSNLEISVKDSGIGIDEANLSKIFKPFTQIDVSSTRTYSGAGLGLAITKKLAELMGGFISVKSSIGQGSVFKVVLPLKTSHVDKKNAAQTEEVRFEIQDETMTGVVLVVEDNKVNSMVASSMLVKTGLSVINAYNGQEALDYFISNQVDLILMDWHMPVMDGLDATRMIRVLSGGNSIPIIGLTANALEEHQKLCLEAGMNDVLTKPIDRNEMMFKIRYWLDKLMV